VFASALLAEGVPAVVGGGGGLYALPEVQALAALVCWACDPLDRLAAAVALRSPLFGLSDGALLRLFGPGSGDALGGLRRGIVPPGLEGGDADGAALAAAALPRLGRAARVAPPDAFLRLADELLDVEAVLLAMPGGEQRLAGVRRLLSLAAAFARDESADTRRFARELATRIDAGAREPLGSAAGRGAVSIGTVHQAKGLEFPVVVLADLAHRPRGERGCLAYASGRGILVRPRVSGQPVAGLAWREARKEAAAVESAEQARLLYVAVTRAEREVVFVAPARADATGFMRFLRPWRERAVSDGVLTLETVRRAAPTPPAPAAQPVPDHEAWVWADGVVRELGRAPLPDGARFSLAVTELESLLQCLRRGALRTQLRVTEPGRPWTRPEREGGDPPLDPLARGRLAHAVLARLATAPSATDPDAFVRDGVAALGYDPADPRLGEVLRDTTRFLTSPLGSRLWALPAEQRRHELPFVHRLQAGAFEVALFGQIDLLYADAEGPVVVDFKYARPSSEAVESYRLQLEAYALAVASLCGVEGPIRTKLVFLGAGTEVGHVVTSEARVALTRRIGEVVAALARVQRAGEVWPGIEAAGCKHIGCGFVGACHPGGSGH
jgi:ATP-dependent helicase/nuclease subunit A